MKTFGSFIKEQNKPGVGPALTAAAKSAAKEIKERFGPRIKELLIEEIDASEFSENDEYGEFVVEVGSGAYERLLNENPLANIIMGYLINIEENLYQYIQDEISGILYSDEMTRRMITKHPAMIQDFDDADLDLQKVAIQSGGPKAYRYIKNPHPELKAKFGHIGDLSDTGVIG